jgi:hypothetical protein
MAAVSARGFNLAGDGEPERVEGALVSADFFHVLAARPLLGRVVDPGPPGPRLAVLSEPFWRRRFGADPAVLGRTLSLDGDPVQMVGVMPASFRLPATAQLWVSARARVPEHPTYPWSGPSRCSSGPRPRSQCAASPSRCSPPGRAVALLLALAGIYGVTAYGVAQRTRELGVRLALGATPRRLVEMVTRETVAVVGVGCAVGLVAGAAFSRLLSGLLFGVSRVDPLTFAGWPLVLTAVAAGAAWVAARRASSVEPADALRHE